MIISLPHILKHNAVTDALLLCVYVKKYEFSREVCLFFSSGVWWLRQILQLTFLLEESKRTIIIITIIISITVITSGGSSSNSNSSNSSSSNSGSSGGVTGSRSRCAGGRKGSSSSSCSGDGGGGLGEGAVESLAHSFLVSALDGAEFGRMIL